METLRTIGSNHKQYHRPSYGFLPGNKIISRLNTNEYSNGFLRITNPPFRDRSNYSSLRRDHQRDNLLMSHVTHSSKQESSIGKELPGDKQLSNYNGVFLLILINLCIFIADHIVNFSAMRHMYLNHANPRWYQFVTANFCHGNWSHLSGNLFFVYVFGKLVEELEGSFGVISSYLLTGIGSNIFSWLLLPKNSVSVGASGAVFGLFAVSVLIRLSWNWRKIVEVAILGQFVVEKVIFEARASASMGNVLGRSSAVNHIAHLSGAIVGAILILVLSKLPSNQSKDNQDLV